MPITTTLDQFRLLIGDTDSTAPLFNDDEAQWFIDQRPGVVRIAAADACDSLAIRFARDFDFKWKDQSFSRSQMSTMYAQLAKDLRSRVAAESGAPWFGGGSRARKDDLAQDSDRVQPAFRRDQFTNHR